MVQKHPLATEQESLAAEVAALKRKLNKLAAEKRRAEQHLAELEGHLKKYEVIGQNAEGAIWVLMDGKVAFANPFAYKLFGRDDENPEPLVLADLVYKEDAPVFFQMLERIASGESHPASITIRIVHPENKMLWVEVRCVPIQWEGRAACLGFLSDISAQKLEEKAIREREQFYSALIENAHDGIAIIQNDRLVYANYQLAEMAGYSLGDILNQSFWRFVHPDDLPVVSEHYNQRISGDSKPQDYEAGILTSDGQRIEVEIHNRIIRYQGKPADFLYIRLLNENGKFEAGINRSEEELRTLVHNLNDMILLTDADTRVKFETPSVSRALGFAPGYLTGKRVAELLHPDDRARVLNDLEEVVAGRGNETPTEFRLSTASGEWTHVEAVAENLLDHPVLQGIVITGREITARKEAQEEINRLRLFNERILQSMLEGILVQDRDGYYRFANPSAGAMLGFTPDELVGKHWREIIAEDNYPIAEAALERRRKGESDGYEIESVRKDGSRIICWVSGNPLFDEQGYAGAVAVYADITDFKRAEMQNKRLLEQQISVNRLALSLGNLTELDEIYQTTAELVGGMVPMDLFAIHVFNPTDQSLSAGFVSAFGELYEASRFPKVLFGDEHHHMLREAIETGQTSYVADFRLEPGEAEKIETLAEEMGAEHYRLLKRMTAQVRSVLSIPMKVGGVVIAVLMTASSQANAYTPEDIGLLGALANIAAIAIQNAAFLEQARQQSEEIQEIINTVPEGVLLLEPDCRVVLANPAAQSHLEVLCPDWSGGTVTRLGSFRLEDLLKPPEVSGWHEVVSERQIFQIVAQPIESGPARGGWVLVIRDVTLEREAERRIQLQERLATVGQLAAGIAHDFNNIMSTIVLYAQMTARSPIIPSRERERINTIYQQAMQATDLIRQILDFSRRSILERQPLSLRPLIKEQVRLFERTLGEDIHIHLSGMETQGLVYADPTRIQQVLLNLAINSRDAMPDGGNMTIGLDEVEIKNSRSAPILDMTPGKWVRLTVTDTGIGIQPDDLPHIFEPFYTTKAPGEGTGLGLAQVYGIVTQHEGFIDIHTQPGAGTTISIYLPALSEVYLQRGDSDSGEITVGNEQTILLVEDSQYTRQALVDSLELLHYRVISASNGQEALDVLDWRQAEIDLVISDVIMPEMSGLTLVREMAKRELRIPVLLLTGHSTGKDLEMMQTVGMVEVMPKPPSLEQLSDVVRRLIDNGKYEG